MRYFCGDIEAVQCFATKAPGRKIWSTAQFNMRFKNGVVGSLTGSYDIARGHPMERTEVAGTGGRFVLDDIFRELTLYPAGSLEKTVYSNPFLSVECAILWTPSVTAFTALSSRSILAFPPRRLMERALTALPRRRC